VFANWQYTNDQVNLSNSDVKIDMENYHKNGEWNIEYTAVITETWSSSIAPDEIYPEV